MVEGNVESWLSRLGEEPKGDEPKSGGGVVKSFGEREQESVVHTQPQSDLRYSQSNLCVYQINQIKCMVSERWPRSAVTALSLVSEQSE